MNLRFVAIATASLGLTAGSALAETVYGLTTSQQLVQFDHANPGVITNTSAVISGLAAGDSIVDIDFYPVNGLLHGIGGVTGNVYRINPITGQATLDVTPQSPIAGPIAVDFNPAADRLRVFGANGQNFRITPSVNTAGPTGANAGLVSNDGQIVDTSGANVNTLVAAAYTNNFDGTAATTLLSIDTSNNQLRTHSGAPQFSTVANVGALGVDVGNLVGFDISPSALALVSNGNTLYTINVNTGLLSSIGNIGPAGGLSIATIAIVPEPATISLLGLATLLLRRR